ncbi:hypothetical protein Tco_0573972 [Tanacetum coccineum]
MEDKFYHLTVKGNDLKTYVRRFQELATLYPTMVPDYEKMMEVFIGGLPQSVEGNVTASKPQTLEEAINIAQRLMDQVTKHTLVQVSEDRKPSGLMLSLQLKKMGILQNRPLFKKCTLHYIGPCTVKFNTCQKRGLSAKNCQIHNRDQHLEVYATGDSYYTMAVRERGIIAQISAKRPPTIMPREEPTC